MLGGGTFLPDIPPFGSCSGYSAKAWQSCSTNTPCNGDYEENSSCSGSQFNKYSKGYSVTASHN
jgi:hypothetical protein